jgi:hypothetical protein
MATRFGESLQRPESYDILLAQQSIEVAVLNEVHWATEQRTKLEQDYTKSLSKFVTTALNRLDSAVVKAKEVAKKRSSGTSDSNIDPQSLPLVQGWKTVLKSAEQYADSLTRRIQQMNGNLMAMLETLLQEKREFYNYCVTERERLDFEVFKVLV